ncbi:ABC transporter permease [Sporosarcina aquimarina]|uniref:ABC transporter permease n=1 Tax=Sporosarcina aquimarina TaxID=114975 RepID=A0ABU4G3Z7_9BACL|nr:ABC transporter permease [Sporosarcina aquimarina]MDW0111038.1 ABC transporter permease [Sporosarcina aquimarina]
MNSLRDVWGNRFGKYIMELQRYLQYVFTGHLAIVLLFSIGAAGYAYSEWLKDVPAELPAAWLVSVLLAGATVLATPVTLLKPADAVYLLPLEKELPTYTKRALNWTFFSKLPLPVILFIVALPLLSAYAIGAKPLYVFVFILLLVVEWTNVHSEFHYRKANEGQGVWQDRMLRFVLSTLLFYGALSGIWLLFAAIVLVYVVYSLSWKKKALLKPFPYNHFIELEQNRMMGFYRFANYFTEVPHLKGSVSKRSWLGIFMPDSNVERTDAQSFLLRRTFIRTDESFWLWLRLTVLSIIGVLFIPFPIVAFIFTGALAFASAIQTLQSLRGGDEFRMDMLYPNTEQTRDKQIFRLTERVQWIQVAGVIIAAFVIHGLSITPLIMGAVVLIISEATIRLTNKETQE